MAVKEISNLKILLLRNSKPQYEVAGACGIHPSQLSRYALGKDWPIPHGHLVALCRYFGVDEVQVTGWQSFDIDPSEEVRTNGNTR